MQIKIPKLQEAHRGSKPKPSSVTNFIYLVARWERSSGAVSGQAAGCVLTFVALAIGTGFVGIEFEQALDDLLVLSSLTGGRTARHAVRI